MGSNDPSPWSPGGPGRQLVTSQVEERSKDCPSPGWRGESSVVRQVRRPVRGSSNGTRHRIPDQHIQLPWSNTRSTCLRVSKGTTSHSSRARWARRIEDTVRLVKEDISLQRRNVSGCFMKLSFSTYVGIEIPEPTPRNVWSKIVRSSSTAPSATLSRRDLNQTDFGYSLSLKVHVEGTRRAGSIAFHWRRKLAHVLRGGEL
jgi:hypothetical protein